MSAYHIRSFARRTESFRKIVTFTAPLLAGVMVLSWGCGCRERDAASQKGKVTIYCSVDEAFGRTILNQFQTDSGIEVAFVFDSEAGKTTGLVNRIISEAHAGRPRGDVFWSSELFSTIRLARLGMLAPYDPPTAADIPPRFRDVELRWNAMSVRARVIAFDPKKASPDSVRASWEGLAAPGIAETVVLANPLFGTTRGHVAAMFALWGPDRGRTWLTKLRDAGARVVAGNSSAVRSVMNGRATIAFTDTDDVWMAKRTGAALELSYPDMGDGGTLLIPCSVAMIKGAKHTEAARRLVDFLVSAEVERMLARSGSRNIPVREKLRSELGMSMPPESKVGFEAITDAVPEAMKAVREILLK